MNEAKIQINDWEHKEEKNIQSEQQEEKRIKNLKKEDRVRSLWENFRVPTSESQGCQEEKLKTYLKK